MATGAFAEDTVMPAGNLVPLRDDVSFEVRSLVGCAVATGFGAVTNTARVEAGSSLLVIGCGGVGLNELYRAGKL